MLRASLAIAGCLACGGPSATAPPAGRPDHAGPGRAPTATPAPRPLDAADCGRLLDHYLAIETAELRARLPAEEVPTDEQRAAIRARFGDEGMAGCVGAARPPFDCAMAADSSAAIKACLAPPPG